jgi:hypothetical protein
MKSCVMSSVTTEGRPMVDLFESQLVGGTVPQEPHCHGTHDSHTDVRW